MDISTNSPKKKSVCIHKLGTSKASEALMKELKQMFEEKHIAKENIRFFGLDGTNAMSGQQKGLQRRIYTTCVTIYSLPELLKSPAGIMSGSLDERIQGSGLNQRITHGCMENFKYSSIRQAVFKNVQILENMTPLKILKACTTLWLTHGETSIHVIV